MKSQLCKKIKIFGKVQGVGFRYWLQVTSVRNGISGWVRNLKTGEVEAHLTGDSDKVSIVMEMCNMGPPASDVDRISVIDSEISDTRSSFDILETI